MEHKYEILNLSVSLVGPPDLLVNADKQGYILTGTPHLQKFKGPSIQQIRHHY